MTKHKYESPVTEAVRMDEDDILCQSLGAGADDLVSNDPIDIFA